MIVTEFDSANASLLVEGLELKALNLLMTQITEQQAMQVAAQINDCGFTVDEKDVLAYARSFSLITGPVARLVTKLCPGCGINHEDELEEDSTGSDDEPPPTVN